METGLTYRVTYSSCCPSRLQTTN